MGLPAETWKRMKAETRTTRPVVAAEPDKNSKHINSVLSGAVEFMTRRRNRTVSTKGRTTTTQHQRVIMSRAARLGLSVKEYEVKFG